MDEGYGDGGRGTSIGSKDSVVTTSTALDESIRVELFVLLFGRGPCRNVWALLRPRDRDGCEARRVRISGSDNDGDVVVYADEEAEGVFSSCILRWRLGDGDGGAERIDADEADASTSNWRDIYVNEFIFR